MKLVCFLVLVLLRINGIAQTNRYFTNQILIRGKASSFVVIEDEFWRNANIGIEFRFGKHHAIGIDYVYFRWRFENDSIVNGTEYSSGYNAFSKRNYLILDYRYYVLNVSYLQKLHVDFYLNPFLKLGKRNIWTENQSTYWIENNTHQITEQQTNFLDGGFAFGIKKGFGVKKRFGVDASLGFAKRYNHILYEKGYDYVTKNDVERTNRDETTWHVHARLNLYYLLKTPIRKAHEK